MKKRKKKMKNPVEANHKKIDLAARIKETADGLFYMSETDAEILPFSGKKAETISSAELLNQIEGKKDSHIEEKDFTEFFARLTEIQDWFGDEERAAAQKFDTLKNLLQNNLRDLKVFKIGEIQIDIYVVGLDAENTLTGIQTKAVET